MDGVDLKTNCAAGRSADESRATQKQLKIIKNPSFYRLIPFDGASYRRFATLPTRCSPVALPTGWPPLEVVG
jgi:hypothetical protein